jgi:hypothetical protein
MYSKDQIERIKQRVNLAELAASYGYAIDGKTGYSRTSLRMKHHGKKIIVATDRKDGHGVFFYVGSDSGGGSAIDFVMLEEGVNLGQACGKLEHWLNIPSASDVPKGMRIPKPEPIARDRAKVIAEWEGMHPYDSGYLKERGLSKETIALFADHIRNGGKFNNTCFFHEDESGITGFEVKNRSGFTGFAGGGEKALFQCRVGEAQLLDCIVITESAIDAMSYYQLHPAEGLYLSIAGGLNPTQPELLRRTLQQYPYANIYIATDNDLPTPEHPVPEGEHYYEIIRDLCPPTATVIRTSPPEPYKDWNDVLTGTPRTPKGEGHSHTDRITHKRSTAKEREPAH